MRDTPELRRLRDLSGIKWQRFGDDVLPAWVADMDFPTAPSILDRLHEMVGSSDFGYNAVSFDDSVATAWAAWCEQRHGWCPKTAQISVFSSALQPIAAALSVGTSPGDGVLLMTPVYPPFYKMIEGAGRRIVEYRLDRNGWRIDRNGLSALLDEGTRALVLCNPHNPSGRVFDADELAAVADFAEEADVLVVSDELWQDIVYPGHRHVPFASLGPQTLARTVTVSSASKSFSLGGLGCAVAHLGHEGVAEAVAALPPQLLGHANALGASATIAAWTAGGEWLDRTLETLRSNRDYLLARLAEELPRARVECPEATYLAWLDLRDAELGPKPAERLLETGRVALSPGQDFGEGGAGFARLNFATHRGVLDEILDRIVASSSR